MHKRYIAKGEMFLTGNPSEDIMDNEELNNLDNHGDASELGKLSAEDMEKFGGELMDFTDEPKETPDKAETKATDADEDIKPIIDFDDSNGESKPRSEGQRRPSSEGQRRPSGDGQRRPRGDGQRRPRPNGQRRPRPDGQRRPRPDGQRRPRPDGQRRPRPDGQGGRPSEEMRRRRPPQSSEKAGGKKKKGWSKKKKTILITVVSIVLTLALIAVVVIVLFFSYTGKLNRKIDSKVNSGEHPIDSSELVSKPDTINKEDQEAKLKEMLAKRSTPINNENVMNILIIGEDLRDTADEQRGNTDVQLLVSINKEKKKIVLASFLRDQYLNINGYGMGRLNTAYWHEGIPLLKETIANYYNINIDRVVKVNFYSFIDVVETIGGVDMDVDQDEFNAINEAIREHNYYLKNPETKDYVKQPGKQHLNGNQALAYARIREGCGDDYGRTERQREMITTIINGMKNMSILELDGLINKVAPQITTDITDGEIASLILNAKEIMGYQICQVQMPHYPYFTEEVINQMAVLVPDYDKCCTLLLDMVYGDSTTVEQAIEKMEAGTINQYTYTQGGGQQQQTDTDPNAQLQQQQQQQQYY